MDEKEIIDIPNSPFQFSSVSLDGLTSTDKFTLCHTVWDKSSSVSGFEKEIINAMNISTDALKASPAAGNILVRATSFNKRITEIHGYQEIPMVKPYTDLGCSGRTALFDAVYSALGSVFEMADRLQKMDYTVNGIIFITTDGDDNESSYTPKAIKELIEASTSKEEIGKITTVLVGINDTADGGRLKDYLMKFKEEAGLDEYISIGDVSASKLAKFGGLISRSVSSKSKHIASGDPNAKVDLNLIF